MWVWSAPWGLGPENIVFPEVMKEEGYKTALVGKWHVSRRRLMDGTRWVGRGGVQRLNQGGACGSWGTMRWG